MCVFVCVQSNDVCVQSNDVCFCVRAVLGFVVIWFPQIAGGGGIKQVFSVRQDE